MAPAEVRVRLLSLWSFPQPLTVIMVYSSLIHQYDGLVTDIQALVVWEVKYNFALMEQLG